jgi:cytochrome c oxidase subunit IV
MIISLFVCLFVLSGIALGVSNHFSLGYLSWAFIILFLANTMD